MKASRKTERKINRLFIELEKLEKDVECGMNWAISRRAEIVNELDKIYMN